MGRPPRKCLCCHNKPQKRHGFCESCLDDIRRRQTTEYFERIARDAIIESEKSKRAKHPRREGE